MELDIKNYEELNEWQKQRMALGHGMVSIKGPAPTGATYSDGTLITRPVNIRWRDTVTGEECDIDYTN